MSEVGTLYLLGINAYHGDVSAVLLRGGELVAALEEERFRRVKHWAGFPTLAIRRCLDIAGIRGAGVARVAISRDPKANLWRKAQFTLTHKPSPRLILGSLRNRRKVHDIRGPLAEALGLPRVRLPQLHFIEHHPAHLASAFFVSPFEEAAVCAIDAFGDFVSTSSAVGSGSSMERLESVYFPHSLGMLYTALTQFIGFMHYGDEYKVMGLAPYGRPRYVEPLRQMVRLKNDGRFELDLRFFRHWSDGVEREWEDGPPTLGPVYSADLERLLGPARRPDEPISEKHEDLAHSIQAVFEECAFHVLNALHDRTGLKRLCLAGGCAMNSVANGKIRQRTPFEDIYIQPAAADNGTALGAAYWVWNQLLGRPRGFVMDHAYWGTSYEDANVLPELAARGNGKCFTWTQYETEEETCRATAKLLADGNVVGWFQGRMEWGARALGNRSILADPRRADMRDLINSKIKFRERFRPFAPSILEERLDDYFVGAVPDPFMQQVYPVREERRQEIPAVTHVDESGRMHTVSREANPKYHRLISEFERLTGTPVLLNTSFNENEPIVESPEQALDCFLRTRMDVIVIGDTVISRMPVGKHFVG